MSLMRKIGHESIPPTHRPEDCQCGQMSPGFTGLRLDTVTRVEYQRAVIRGVEADDEDEAEETYGDFSEGQKFEVVNAKEWVDKVELSRPEDVP